MTAAIIRIVLRYVAGILIAKGLVDSATAMELARDPDVLMLSQTAVGIAAGVAAEAWYWLAKRMGWAT